MTGQGKGNWNHAGRPGHVGGSAPGGASHLPSPTSVDSLSLEENKAQVAKLVEVYKTDSDLRGAATVVSQYLENQDDALLTREIAAQTLKGLSSEKIIASAKVQKLLSKSNAGTRPEFQLTDAKLKNLVESSAGYYKSLRDVQPSTDVVYRGGSITPNKEEIELRGPTAFSHSKDIAAHYSKSTLIELNPGAKLLPSRMLQAIKAAAEGDEHATMPAFYTRHPGAGVHPKGPGWGYAIDFDSDRELTTSGRYKVVNTRKDYVSYKDALSGKKKGKYMTIVTLEQIGQF